MSWAGAVERGDLDEAVRWVGRLADAGDWDELDALRRRCRAAHERGHQLWPAASLAAHRIALDGPVALAVAVAGSDPAAFTLGPLWEVVASRRTWEELAPHLEPGPTAGLMAQERVLRGDAVMTGSGPGRDGPGLDGPGVREPGPGAPDLGDPGPDAPGLGDPGLDAPGLDAPGLDDGEVPLRLATSEPAYCLATYGPDEVVVDAPALPDLGPPHRLGPPGRTVTDAVAAAWRLVVEPWCSQSEGRLRSVAVGGDGEQAVAALAGDGLVQLTEIDLGTAMTWLQWAAASGGAHGRRRGGAVGRALAWWLVATAAGVVDDWPLTTDELDRWGGELRWWLWLPLRGPVSGWHLRMAVADPDSGVAWAVDAVDAAAAVEPPPDLWQPAR